MELPRALWPWQQSLSIFPRDLAISLGGIIDKLALLVGPLVSPDGAGRNEPDGFDGIGRRGSFERLLTTDWALAEEAPLEFLRRVTAGELSFLEIAHKKPTIARQCIVLFDVGPDQRGGPRIVHLAALILLAQRAHDGGASFSWGVLQDSPSELFSDVNEESVRKLIQAPNLRRTVIDGAITFYQTLAKEEAEVWFVGGRGTSKMIEGANVFHVEIEDSFDPDAPFDLHVTVVGEKSKPRAVRLELPPSNVAVRLLRDPFQVARVTPQKSRVRIAPDTNIVFTRDYRKLFLRGAEGELITIPIPNSPNSKETSKPRVFRPPDGETLVGVGRLMGVRTIVAVTWNYNSVFVHKLSPRVCTSVECKAYAWDRHSDPLAGSSNPTWIERTGDAKRLGTLFQLGTNEPLFLHDGEHMLFKLEDGIIQSWTYSVPTAHQEGSTLYWVAKNHETIWVQYSHDKRHELSFPADTREVRCAPGGFIAKQDSSTTWQIMNATGEVQSTTTVPPEYQVLGFITGTNGGFVVMDASRTTISFLTNDAIETWVKTSAPIKTVNAIPGCWLIAFITDEAELCIHSFGYKTLLLRMRLGDA